MDAFFSLADDKPMPNRACVRVRDLPASPAVAGLKQLCVEAFGELLTKAWLFEDRSPFIDSDYRLPIEYVHGFEKVCDHDCPDALLGRCVNLAEIARGLVTLLECYTPYKVKDRRAAMELRGRLLQRAEQIVEQLEALE